MYNYKNDGHILPTVDHNIKQETAISLHTWRGTASKRSLYSPSTHHTHLIFHVGTAAETTFTPTQYMYCVLTDCTRTTRHRTERVINHIPDGLFPPWSEKVQRCVVSTTFLYPAISITQSQLEACWRAKPPDISPVLSEFINCSFDLQHFWSCNMVLP